MLAVCRLASAVIRLRTDPAAALAALSHMLKNGFFFIQGLFKFASSLREIRTGAKHVQEMPFGMTVARTIHSIERTGTTAAPHTRAMARLEAVQSRRPAVKSVTARGVLEVHPCSLPKA
jgi:hypothetical protein